jgi:hypothetical protein
MHQCILSAQLASESVMCTKQQRGATRVLMRGHRREEQGGQHGPVDAWVGGTQPHWAALTWSCFTRGPLLALLQHLLPS